MRRLQQQAISYRPINQQVAFFLTDSVFGGKKLPIGQTNSMGRIDEFIRME